MNCGENTPGIMQICKVHGFWQAGDWLLYRVQKKVRPHYPYFALFVLLSEVTPLQVGRCMYTLALHLALSSSARLLVHTGWTRFSTSV